MLNSHQLQPFIDFIENYPGFVSVRDKQSRIVLANSKFKELFSMENTIDVIGCTNQDIANKVSSDLANVLHDCHELETGFIQNNELNNRVVKCIENNEIRYIDILKFQGFDTIENHIITFGKDITQMYDEVVYHKNRSCTDPLTQLGNRKLLDETAFSTNDLFIYADLDNFKSINDIYGHLVGDEVLVTLSSMLRGLFREHDTIVRMGGDEFLIVIKDVVNTTLNVEQRIEELRQVFKETFLSYPQLGISLGYSNFILNIDKTLKIIDERMYQDKKQKHFRLA